MTEQGKASFASLMAADKPGHENDAAAEKLHHENSSMTDCIRLEHTEDGLTLTDGKLSMRGDFMSLLPRIRRGNLHKELLVRAAGWKSMGEGKTDTPTPLVLDATAGLGEDSFLLAAAGLRVELYERDPVIAQLLEDALERAAEDPELAPVVSRMTLHCEDSIAAMQRIGQMREAGEDAAFPDVIFLDPMFPGRTKSALVGKKFQLLQQLEKPCDDEQTLLSAAVLARPRRIVIKRPAKGPYLSGRKPDFSLPGKAVRYDVILLHS